MSKKLFIDTSDSTMTKVGLIINGDKKVRQEFLKKASQNLLILINEIILENDLNFHDISEIQVNRGPGSYTGLRVGIAAANTLAFILGIPINNQKKGKLAKPKYK